MRVSRDYEQAGKPSCDWDDPQSRSGLIDSLVTDGLAVLKSVEDLDLDTVQADAVGLLAVVVGQDTEPVPDRKGNGGSPVGWPKTGTINGGRPPSTSRTQQRRRSVRTDTKRISRPNRRRGSSPPVTSPPANVPDGAVGVELLEDDPRVRRSSPTRPCGSGKTRAVLEKAGHSATVKPIPQKRNHRLGDDQYTRVDFVIDHQNRRVIARPVTPPPSARKDGHGSESLHRLSPPQSLHHQQNGRQMRIHPHDRLLVRARQKWKHRKTRHRYNKHRPTVERLIAHTVATATETQIPGTTRNRQQLHTRVAAINLWASPPDRGGLVRLFGGFFRS